MGALSAYCWAALVRIPIISSTNDRTMNPGFHELQKSCSMLAALQLHMHCPDPKDHHEKPMKMDKVSPIS
jgi:hypothetical protein